MPTIDRTRIFYEVTFTGASPIAVMDVAEGRLDVEGIAGVLEAALAATREL